MTAVETVNMVVSMWFSVRVNDLTAKGRKQPAAGARHVAMYLCHKCANMKHKDIAAAYGRNRTTAIYAIRFVEDRSSVNIKYEDTIKFLHESAARQIALQK